jgi:hypothetical protein
MNNNENRHSNDVVSHLISQVARKPAGDFATSKAAPHGSNPVMHVTSAYKP